MTATLSSESSRESFNQGYYDARFREGYADHWPAGRYERIQQLVTELALPPAGAALDFGCGNGSFTALLGRALPGWQVRGADLSDVALANARRHHQGVSFVNVAELGRDGQRFDLIFSHHVLEHVPDIAATWRLFASIAAPGARMLHVLPCGDAGSLEHTLASLRRDGIDPSREGRFYCDDEPHVRRLTSAQMVALGTATGFALERAYYSQRYWSQLWPYAQKSVGDLIALTDRHFAVDASASRALARHRALFLALAIGCWPTLYRWRLKPAAERRLADHAKHAAALVFSPAAFLISRYLRRQDQREWDRTREQPGGAEMYMSFRRTVA